MSQQKKPLPWVIRNIWWILPGFFFVGTTWEAEKTGRANYDFLSDPGAWLVLGVLGFLLALTFRKKPCRDPHCPVHGNQQNGH